jgi:V8-like Glu-specific endopeptidase
VGLVAIAALAAAAVPAASGAVVVKRSQASAASTAAYWTAERMAAARPLTATRGGAGASLRLAPQPPPFDSFAVPDPTTPPLTTHGKLFGTLRGFGQFECSATVAQSAGHNVVFTAGHCVADPRSRTVAKRLMFVPSYDNGARPFGRWTASTSRAPRDWLRRENFDFDYATLTMRPQGGLNIEDVVGGRPLATDTPRTQTYNAYGYPSNFANAQQMWGCRGPYAGDDPRPLPGGPPPVGMACNMKTGASGGGWVDDFGQLVSVSSFGYRARPGFLYGPYLTGKAARLVARSG